MSAAEGGEWVTAAIAGARRESAAKSIPTANSPFRAKNCASVHNTPKDVHDASPDYRKALTIDRGSGGSEEKSLTKAKPANSNPTELSKDSVEEGEEGNEGRN